MALIEIDIEKKVDSHSKNHATQICSGSTIMDSYQSQSIFMNYKLLMGIRQLKNSTINFKIPH